jgi:hypothetical protein
MGGPIVRTGTTPAFWENWEKAFGKPASGSRTGTAKKSAAKSAKPKAAAKSKKKKK